MPERPERVDVQLFPGTGHVEIQPNAQLKVRMREELRALLEEAATRRGVSMNAEVVDRLQASFSKEDRYGGPEMLAIVNLMAGAFLRGGQLGARASQHPEWSTAEWMDDPFAYAAAVETVVEALKAARPK